MDDIFAKIFFFFSKIRKNIICHGDAIGWPSNTYSYSVKIKGTNMLLDGTDSIMPLMAPTKL